MSQPPGLRDFNEMVVRTVQLDDRSAILTLSAFADEALKGLLLEFLRPTKITKEFVSDAFKPFASFSARISGAYVMGLLTDDQFDDLNKIRQIRNECAHGWDQLDLSQGKLKKLIDGLNVSLYSTHSNANPIDKFRETAIFVILNVNFMRQRIAREGLQLKMIGEVVPLA